MASMPPPQRPRALGPEAEGRGGVCVGGGRRRGREGRTTTEIPCSEEQPGASPDDVVDDNWVRGQ